MDTEIKSKRGGWGSNFGFLMASIGSAVGLGNIWGFPYKMGKSGGAVFLLLYLVLVVLVGVTVMLGELALGRRSGKSAVSTYRGLSKKYTWLGYAGIVCGFCIMCFYFVLGGIVLRYAVGYFLAIFGGSEFAWSGQGTGFFGYFLTDTNSMILFFVLYILLNILVVSGGVQGGIEKFCGIGMPALFFMLLICIVRACTLPGAVDGLKYMFIPGWAVANGVIEEAPDFLSVLSTAGGQMFFSLSLGMGAMITYGSYLDRKQNLEKNALIIVIMDTLVALMAGLCVIPGRFALDPTGELGGPKLLFITMQNVFEKMPMGALFGLLFYLLVVFAAISSSISLLEVIVAHFVDKAREAGKGDKRKTYSLVAALGCAALCTLVCLDALGTKGIAPANILGIADPKTWAADWLDFFDCISEGILMPLGALLMSIMIGWELGPKAIRDECELTPGHSMTSYRFFRVCVRYITPLCMLLILYGQIKEFFFT